MGVQLIPFFPAHGVGALLFLASCPINTPILIAFQIPIHACSAKMAGVSGFERSGSDSMEDKKSEIQEQAPQSTAPSPALAKKPNLLKNAWAKTGLDKITILLMLKGALPPIICIAAYQSDAWAEKYSTLGYLSAIMSFISLGIQPRGKFIQSTTISILFVCIGAATALLQIRCVTSARQHSTPATASHATAVGSSGGQESVAYNSSASVVSGCFMFAEIYLANMVRAKRPQLMIPTIQYSIFVIVTSSYCVTFPTMAAGESFVKRLLDAFLTGIGIAAGVSLFVVPMTSRTIARNQMAGILVLIKASMNAHTQYLMSLTRSPASRSNGNPTDGKAAAKAFDGKKATGKSSTLSSEARVIQNIRNQLAGLFGKLNLEFSFAKKEVAWGNLRPHHFTELFDLLREIILPIAGMSTFIDIMQSYKHNKTGAAEAKVAGDDSIAAIERLESEEWDEVMALSHDKATKLKGVLCQALTHISYQLKLTKKPNAPKGDVEKAAGGSPVPGGAGFTAALESEISQYACHREDALQRWCNHKGIELPTSFWDDPSKHYSLKDLQQLTETAAQKHNQQQLYLILYIEYLTLSIGNGVLKLCQYADGKVEDGTMTKKRLIFPALRKISKLWTSVWSKEDSEGEHFGEGPAANIYLGDSFKARKNPEHLHPSNRFQKMTDYFRLVSLSNTSE